MSFYDGTASPQAKRTRSALSCREVSRRVQTYVDGQLDAETCVRLEAHLAACSRCQCETETLRELKAALRRQAIPCDELALARLRAFGRRLCSGEIDAQ